LHFLVKVSRENVSLLKLPGLLAGSVDEDLGLSGCCSKPRDTDLMDILE
jgi:hypothetical protein